MHVRTARLPDDLPSLELLFDTCRIADGHEPLGEHKYLDLMTGSHQAGAGLVAQAEDLIVGYAHLTPDRSGGMTLEAAIHPLHRRPETAKRLLVAAVDMARSGSASMVRVWVFQPMVARVLTSLGFRPERELRQLRRRLPPEARPQVPPGIRIAPFRVGRDEATWLEVNNRAFAGHTENGSWTEQILADRMATDWFDPAGFRMAWKGESLAGFCWTKTLETGKGEIYVIAVDPPFQGAGLGSALALDGLWYLHDRRQVDTAVLYVDSDNEAGLRLYRRLEFDLDHVDRSFTLRW